MCTLCIISMVVRTLIWVEMLFSVVPFLMSLISYLSLDTWSQTMLTHIYPHSIEPQCCFSSVIVCQLSFFVGRRHWYVCWFYMHCLMRILPSVLWRCWLGGRKGIRPVKTEWWGAGVLICLERGADLHTAQLMPLPITISCFIKIQIGFTFLVPVDPSCPGKKGR